MSTKISRAARRHLMTCMDFAVRGFELDRDGGRWILYMPNTSISADVLAMVDEAKRQIERAICGKAYP